MSLTTSMVKHLSQGTGHPCPPSLLPINRIHTLVREKSKRKGKVHPAGKRSPLVQRVEEQESTDVGEDKAEADEGDGVRGNVLREQGDEPCPEWTKDVLADDGLVDTRVFVGVKPCKLGLGDTHGAVLCPKITDEDEVCTTKKKDVNEKRLLDS